MNGELGPNAKAILLLTAPLVAGKPKRSVRPLSLGEYGQLARHLHESGRQPADLFDPGARKGLNEFRPKLDIERVHRLLGRGFLLAQAMERWQARAIWVVTRADDEYPRILKKRMREKAPPVLYGCGERNLLDRGGLAVVGSRHVNEGLVRYTEHVGRLAAEAGVAIVSGGARGVDQAAMRGALDAGGRVLGVLANALERAALSRPNRAPLMGGRLALVCPYDPSVRFLAGYAMQRNKLIYALADAALVVNSDHGHGGTWAGATEQLGRLHFVPVYVRRGGEPCAGLDALARRGAESWPDPQTPADMRGIVWREPSLILDPAGPVQQNLFGPETVAGVKQRAVPESAVTAARETPRFGQALPSFDGMGRAKAVRKAKRLLPVMTGDLSRKEICHALGLSTWQHVKETYVDPCLDEGWIVMTNPKKPSSPKQRFRRSRAGRILAATFDDA